MLSLENISLLFLFVFFLARCYMWCMWIWYTTVVWSMVYFSVKMALKIIVCIQSTFLISPIINWNNCLWHISFKQLVYSSYIYSLNFSLAIGKGWQVPVKLWTRGWLIVAPVSASSCYFFMFESVWWHPGGYVEGELTGYVVDFCYWIKFIVQYSLLHEVILRNFWKASFENNSAEPHEKSFADILFAFTLMNMHMIRKVPLLPRVKSARHLAMEQFTLTNH